MTKKATTSASGQVLEPEQSNIPAQSQANVPAEAKLTQSPSERFTAMVIREFAFGTGTQIALTEFQRRLCQNYFILLTSAIFIASSVLMK